uniref:Putative ribonuclease n=1 Tax=Trypanosoma congolense (strain IL3000) TaxID=1068625 RepID=G0UUV1_TRYCI|nr:putative ribonuclease [Trypanosoma congolense IL3000]
MSLITRENFDELYPKFVEEINNASYIAVDLEFTGIDRKERANFLIPPEEVFRDKMEAARTFRVIEIGFSIFYDDDRYVSQCDCSNPGTGRGQTSENTLSTSHVSYSDLLISALRDLQSANPEAQTLLQLLDSIAAKGAASEWDVARLRELQSELKTQFLNSTHCGLFDDLFMLSVIDDVNIAVGAADNLRKYPDSAGRRMCSSCYYFYLLPHPEKDPWIVMSAKTVQFLRANDMDLNAWTTNGLYYLPLDEYVEVRRENRPASEKQGGGNALETRLGMLKNWMQNALHSEQKNQVLNMFESVARFARTARTDDTCELCLPHLDSSASHELDTLLRGVGIRHWKRTMKKISVEYREEVVSDIESECLGTRLLSAFVLATHLRRKPVIVHNGLSDMAFLCSLLRKDLPDTLPEFKAFMHSAFPVFYDTRTLTCSPKLQNIPNLTGPLKKTYTILRERNTDVVMFDKRFRAIQNWDIKDHHSACDAFMTGSLFAYVQQEFARVGADYRSLACITPVHGCIFCVDFSSDNTECLLIPPNAPAFVAHRQPTVPFCVDALRDRLSPFVKAVSFLYNGDSCLITILESLSSHRLSDVVGTVKEWGRSFSYTIEELDVEQYSQKYGIRHVQ